MVFHNFPWSSKKNFENFIDNGFSSTNKNRPIVILFVIAYTLSLVELYFFVDLYTKSLFYYLLMGICASCIFIIVALAGEKKTWHLPVFLAILLQLNIFLSNYIVFPNGVYATADTHYQLYNIILPTLKNATLPNEFYSHFPLHQLLVVVLSLFTEINPIFLYTYLIGIFYAFASLFIYQLGKAILGSKLGIICMIFFSIAPEIVYHATHAYQFSYAMVFSIIFFYLFASSSIISTKKSANSGLSTNKRINLIALRLLFFVSLVWTHQFTSTVTIVLTFILILSFTFNSNSKVVIRTYVIFIALCFCILLSHWMYFAVSFSSLVRIVDLYFNSLFTPENYYQATTEKVILITTTPLLVEFLNISGKGIIFFFSVIGSLYGLSKKNAYILSMTFLSIFIFGLISVGSVIDMYLLLSGRLLTFFWATSFIFLAGFGIIFFINRFKLKGVLFCAFFLVIATTLSLGSYAASEDANLFNDYYTSVGLYDSMEDVYRFNWIQNVIPNSSLILVNKKWAYSIPDFQHKYDDLEKYSLESINNLAETNYSTNMYVVVSDRYLEGSNFEEKNSTKINYSLDEFGLKKGLIYSTSRSKIFVMN